MVVVDEQCRRNRRLAANLCFLIKEFFPPVSLLQGTWIRSVGNDDATGAMTSVQRLEDALSVHVGALIPELHAHLLTIDAKNLEREVGVLMSVALAVMSGLDLTRIALLFQLTDARGCRVVVV